MSGVRIEQVTTRGVFSLDGQDFDVENNVWLLGDDDDVVVVDAAHDAAAIERAVSGRHVVAIVSTHGHNDHVNAAPALAAATGAPVLLHPDDHVLWRMANPDVEPDGELAEGQRIEVAGLRLEIIHTPGHAPGAVSVYVPDLGTVFTGDTLFAGGPGATGRSYSHFPTILRSIRERLLVLPGDTVVRTGHGSDTTIAAEGADYDVWVARGY